MTRPGAISIVALIFVGGVAVGVLGAQLYPDIGRHLHQTAGVLFHGRSHPHGHVTLDDPRHIDLLAERLGLSEEQAKVVAEILGKARREAHRLHREFEPRVHEHIRQTRDQVVAVLTPEQVERLDRLTEEHRGDLERMFLTPDAP